MKFFFSKTENPKINHLQNVPSAIMKHRLLPFLKADAVALHRTSQYFKKLYENEIIKLKDDPIALKQLLENVLKKNQSSIESHYAHVQKINRRADYIRISSIAFGVLGCIYFSYSSEDQSKGLSPSSLLCMLALVWGLKIANEITPEPVEDIEIMEPNFSLRLIKYNHFPLFEVLVNLLNKHQIPFSTDDNLKVIIRHLDDISKKLESKGMRSPKP